MSCAVCRGLEGMPLNRGSRHLLSLVKGRNTSISLWGRFQIPDLLLHLLGPPFTPLRLPVDANGSNFRASVGVAAIS